MVESAVDSVAFYDRNAQRFAAETGRLDLSVLYERFLRYVPSGGHILDAGCGVGRDALAFVERGYAVLAFDASVEMVRLTRACVAGRVDVQRMRFEQMAWTDAFDGIWACASLLHVPAAEFPAIATRLATALRPRGVCYLSFKLGTGDRIVGDRYFADHTEASLRAAIRGTGLELVDTWATDDVRADRISSRWLNALATHAECGDCA